MRIGSRLLTPLEIKHNGQEYKFFTNIPKEHRLHIQKAAELNGYTVIFVDNASDSFLNPMPTDYAVYMLKTDADKFCSFDRMINTSIELRNKYKAKLIKMGYDLSNISIQDIYLGCEKNLKR